MKSYCPSATANTLDIALADIANATTTIVSYVRSHPNVKYVVASTDGLTIGLPGALKAAGLNVKLVGQGATPTNIQYLKSGQEVGDAAFPYNEVMWVDGQRCRPARSRHAHYTISGAAAVAADPEQCAEHDRFDLPSRRRLSGPVQGPLGHQLANEPSIGRGTAHRVPASRPSQSLTRNGARRDGITNQSDGASVTSRGPGATGRSPVIAGLGITEMGKVYGRTTAEFAADAVRRAAADAGMSLGDIDGLLVSTGVTGGVGLELQRDLNLRDLGLLSEMQAFGATAGGMLQLASMAVQWGSSEVVACVFADAPLRQDRATSAAYGGRGMGQTGWRGITAASGVSGANPLYAMAARRHMERYGTSSEQLAEVAVAQRDWAALNPLAQMRDPITVADHQTSRMIAEPFRLLRLLSGVQRRGGRDRDLR